MENKELRHSKSAPAFFIFKYSTNSKNKLQKCSAIHATLKWRIGRIIRKREEASFTEKSCPGAKYRQALQKGASGKMKKYAQELVERLGNTEEIIQVYGSDVILKRSPSDPRPGYMDPHEIAALPEAEEHVGEKKEGIPPLDILVRLMRDSMGFPNLNLNTAEIITKYEEKNFAGNSVELWRYFKRRSKKEKRPAFLMIHGGGWVGGSVYVVENFCKLIAERADAVVFNLEYSKGPEKPFPHAQNDCYHALEYVYEHAEEYGIDENRIAIGGDSAGGNLAIATAIRARNNGKPYIKLMALAYPCTVKCDASMDGYEWSHDVYEIAKEQKELIESCLGLGHPVKFGDDPIELMTMQSEEDIYNPYYSPMMDPDKSGMPGTLLMCCEFDGLRQQDEFYAMQLAKAGNHVRCIRYGGISHAAVDRLGFIPQAEDMVNEIVKVMEEMVIVQS